MTDQEVIATFMEPHKEPLHDGGRSIGGWWIRAILHVGKDAYETTTGPWMDAIKEWTDSFKLSRMFEVEEKLPEGLRMDYIDRLFGERSLQAMLDKQQFDYADAWWLIHATAEQKIAALAVVLRMVVEGKC